MKVSIITVCLNSSSTLEYTINSVLSQTYSDIEYIIIDGKSVDNTIDIINKYKNKISYFISEKDNGIYDAMNKGIRISSGDLVCILNSDDFYCEKTTIDCVVHHLRLNPESDACYGNLKLVSNKNINLVKRLWIPGIFNKENYKYGWMIPHPCLFVKKSIYQKIGLFRTDFSTAADYEFMFRTFFVNSFIATYIPKFLVAQRVGGASQSITSRFKANKFDLLSWQIHGLSPPWYFRFFKPLSKLKQYFN